MSCFFMDVPSLTDDVRVEQREEREEREEAGKEEDAHDARTWCRSW